MKRSISSQIIGTLHLMLRIILGIVIVFTAVATIIFVVSGIFIGFWLSSKYGSPFEDPTTWVMMATALAAIPSFAAGLIVIFKNKLNPRNPAETLLAAVNVTSNILLYRYVFSVGGAITAVMLAATVATAASAFTILILNGWQIRPKSASSEFQHVRT